MLSTLLANVWSFMAIVFVINILYVTLLTLRLIFTLKGQKYFAGLFGIIETLVYVIGLGLVLENLDNYLNLVAYSVGFGTGVLVGMKIEEKLALGYITVNVITKEYEPDIPNTLRDKGYGVTNWVAYGREGERMMMEILTSRKSEARLYRTVKELDAKAFIISHEPKAFFGGFWVKGIRR